MMLQGVRLVGFNIFTSMFSVMALMKDHNCGATAASTSNGYGVS